MAITTRQNIFDNASQGKGLVMPFNALASSGTGAGALSGRFNVHIMPNNIGTTAWTTVQGLPVPPGLPSPTRLTSAQMFGENVSSTFMLGRAYLCGTINLTAGGNQFTHDAATFPILRNQMGASTALNLIPILLITTSTTTTAAVFQLRTAAAGNGYTNQDGTGVVGAKSFTLPSVATSVGSGFVLRLEDGDSAVRDITQVNVTTPASVGTASIYLFDPLCCLSYVLTSAEHISGPRNAVFNPPSIPNLAAGIATSGTAVAPLIVLSMSTSNSTLNAYGIIKAYTE